MDDEEIVEFTGKEIIIRAAGMEEVDFSKEILKDLTDQEYSGQELIHEFVKIKSRIPKALNDIKKEAMEEPMVVGKLDDYLDTLDEIEKD